MEMRKRATAALAQLKSQPTVDTAKTAAIGYCFGGTVVLELARSNADVLGVVSFHGGLDADPSGPTADVVKPHILACHGAADPNVPRKTVEAFEDEMTKAHADWYLTLYADAVHGFTNPANPPSNASKGVAYNEKADKRSWIAMQDFFHEIFG
jgi:dienelactone hydrolase